MSNRFEIDPQMGWIDTYVESAARAMYEDECGGWDDAPEDVRSTYRRRASAVAAAGLLRTEPATPRVPQPGDRVRVNYHGTSRSDTSVVGSNGGYTEKGNVALGAATVEVIEPIPATTFAATGQHAFGLLALGDRDGSRAVLAAADLKTLFAIGDISHALNELVAEVLRSRPADTGKGTVRYTSRRAHDETTT